MKQIQASCKVQGTLTIPSKYHLINGSSETGNYADYTLNSPEALFNVAKTYKYVERGNMTIDGSSYTLKMAQNDFNKYSGRN